MFLLKNMVWGTSPPDGLVSSQMIVNVAFAPVNLPVCPTIAAQIWSHFSQRALSDPRGAVRSAVLKQHSLALVNCARSLRTAPLGSDVSIWNGMLETTQQR